jgi:hypothetical protein
LGSEFFWNPSLSLFPPLFQQEDVLDLGTGRHIRSEIIIPLWSPLALWVIFMAVWKGLQKRKQAALH